jgi:hypothetical protein
MRVSTGAIVAAAVALFIVGCGNGNPSRPSVSFVSPSTAGPAAGAQIKANQQPISLSIVNAVRTGNLTAKYTFEVATDSGFGSVVARKADVPEDPSGTTSTAIGILNADTTYYWRARATIDGVDGAFSQTRTFRVLVPVIFEPPAIVSPAADGEAYGDRPTFIVRNASRTGPAGTVFYDFSVSSDSGFTAIVAQGRVQEQSGHETSFTPDRDLPEGSLFWRARAVDPSNDTNGPYTTVAPFRRLQGVDLTRVIYVKGPNISGWPQTSTITNAYIADGQLCIFHTRLGQWPATDFFEEPGPILEGNQWVMANINGTWYGGAADWYRPGQACKNVDRNVGRDSFADGVLSNWTPRSGEVIGVMSTTPARLWPAMKTLDQRTNVALIRWP